MAQKNKQLIIITGAAGTGKTTVSHYLSTQFGAKRVITHTTRAPRQGEVDGRDYYFETPESFYHNHFVEHVEYAGQLYGSSEEGLKKALADHDLACLVLDTKGAVTYLQRFPEMVCVLYLTVGDESQLHERMAARGDSSVALDKRLHSKEYHRDLNLPAALRNHVSVITNDDWAVTQQRISQFMARCKQNVSMK